LDKEEVLGFYKGKGHWSLIHAYGFINSLDKGFFKKKGWEGVLKEELKRSLKNLFRLYPYPLRIPFWRLRPNP